jgi:DNA-binding Xre family transcriptional regulator
MRVFFHKKGVCVKMISYNPLWQLLKANNINPLDVCHDACITKTELKQLNENQSVELSVVDRICCVLGCSVEDVVEIIFL